MLVSAVGLFLSACSDCVASDDVSSAHLEGHREVVKVIYKHKKVKSMSMFSEDRVLFLPLTIMILYNF